MPYIKNPKGRIVTVTAEAKEYLLADAPTKTINGAKLLNKKGEPVAAVKSEHEKGYSEPTDAEIKAYEAAMKKGERIGASPQTSQASSNDGGNGGNEGTGGANDPWYASITGIGKATADKLAAEHTVESAEDLKTALGASNEEATPELVKALGGAEKADAIRAQVAE